MNPIVTRVTDDRPLWPWVMLSLIIICVAMMAGFQVLSAAGKEAWLKFWGFDPAQVMTLIRQTPRHWLSLDMAGLFTALFVHSGWLHLIGNLAYLWVFGIAVERAIGHIRFLLAFLLIGGFANFCVAWQLADLRGPVIGASGGVSAIIGVYLGLFPTHRIGLWLPLGIYLQFARVPALLVIGSWFTLQLLYTAFGPVSGAVAWWTHVAGFLAGVTVALLLRILSPRVLLAVRED